MYKRQGFSLRIGGAEGCWNDCAYLEAEDLGLDQGEGLAVNLDEALALL